MAVHALDAHIAVPAGAQDPCDAARVVAVGLVAHGGQGVLDLPGFHADHLEAGGLQAVGKERVKVPASRPTDFTSALKLLKH